MNKFPLERERGSAFVRNFAKLFAGTAIAKAVGFLAIPAIAHLVSPEKFGEYSIFNSIILVLSPLLGLRYVDALPVVKGNYLTNQLLTLTLLLIFVNATVFLGVAFLLLGFIGSLYPFIDVKFLVLVYLGSITMSVIEVLSLWAVRLRNYGIIAQTQVVQSIAGAFSKVILSYAAVPLSLMLGQVIQNITGVISLMATKKRPFKSYKPIINVCLASRVARLHSHYPKFRLPSQMLLVMTQAIPILSVGHIYGQAAAGQLGLAFSMVSVPALLVVGNVRKLYYGEAAKYGAARLVELRSLTLNLMFKMAIVSVPSCLLLYFFAEELFSVFLGDEWRLAGRICSLYSLYVMSQFIVGPTVDLLNVLNLQKQFLAINFARFVVVVMVFLVVGTKVAMLELVLLYSLVMFIFYAGLAAYFYKLLSRREVHA